MARCGAHRLLPDFFTCTFKVLVDFKHSACDGFAFIKLLNPDKSKFESLSFCKPGRACQSVRIVPCHRKRRSRSLRFVPSGAQLHESRQHRVGPFVFLLRHGVTFKNLDCTTGLLSFEMSRFFRVLGSRISGAVQSRSSCPWFECTSYVFPDVQLHALRSSRYSSTYCFLFPSWWSDCSSCIRSASVVVKVSLSSRSASGCH